ncbi:hypothetical protein CO2235_MP60069 [Cupriavidus oxalaticus]|uniref:Uncharacterized protein n=1 Tax=Cupriavidus oxalaticus TaxID=96344 RepID=A0A375GLV3_9BURK|nr:hypothetical protein CO2235_MP60069 [Cupriavidus oxalaticus]
MESTLCQHCGNDLEGPGKPRSALRRQGCAPCMAHRIRAMKAKLEVCHQIKFLGLLQTMY